MGISNLYGDSDYIHKYFSNQKKGELPMKLEKDLVVIDLKAGSKEEVLEAMGKLLIGKGIVKEGFIESILQREKDFPTGLPTEPFGVAIPHTDGEMVNDSKIAFASLKTPVKFLAMGRNDERIDVKVVFMLALKTPEDQLEMLQKLVGLFQDPQTVMEMAEIKDAEQLNELLRNKE
ncbi:PTS sugar transporter subunit IIA [Planomicrobium sp. CPCC 101079]|uniref:PTS sugar transporter subunit IIA n=1 Tax=Planomicrobium sp. CPCC 101079 TaxID=2599618 RepID=UPI0011B4CEF0|nr:PTS sugar transporter subunit IIA [Planomicrobium sp. CPCC 101079]TWT09254.1 PTS sugar transporter subunit IIA [Planomicrobium sp. CPCC 101079]